MKDVKVVVFDCDGVMFDTKKANSAFYNQILEHFDKPGLTPEQFDFCHMHTVNESIARLFDNEKEAETAHTYRKTMGYGPFIKYMEIEPDIRFLLEWLKPRYKTAIATNRSDTMDQVLEEFGLKRDFDLVVTSLDVERPKPYPDPLIKVLDYFNTEPNSAVYVGDSELDEKAAKAAGIPLIAYDNPSLTADFHITSLREIKDILEQATRNQKGE
ncbi:MAG: HAD family hydrolase [Desulfobacteraceae bacterium]|nr:HAD family hydrolase [Desulfobacteraceae bacterium]